MGGSFIDDDWELSSASDGVRTVVLVGCTGNGKSATGNSILGRKEFTSKSSLDGVTNTSEIHTTVLEDGQIINVIDTPGLFDKLAKPEFVEKEIVRCIGMAKDGIHALLVVVSLRNRISIEAAAAIETLQKFFGDNIAEYMILVFTGGDQLEEDEETLDDFLSSSESVKGMLEICGNRRVLFDNKTKDIAKKAEQLKQLLSLVNDVVMKNGGKPYTNELFVEFKKGAIKLHDQAVELNSSQGNSKEKKFELEQQMYKSHEEHLRRITDMVETKLRDTTRRLEQQLAEEQAARIRAEETVREGLVARSKAEETARKAQVKSDNEIRELRENLERSRRAAEELERNRQNQGCQIL